MYDALKTNAWVESSLIGEMTDAEIFRAGRRMVCVKLTYWHDELTFVLKEGFEVSGLIADLKNIVTELERQRSLSAPVEQEAK